MSEIIFSAVVGDLAGRVISLLAGQFKGQDSTEAKLQRICYMLVKVHSAIEEARGRQITNFGTLEWLSELNDGLYQGRYLLETVGCREQDTAEDDEPGDKVVAAQPFSLSLFNPAKRVRVAACRVRSLLSRHDVGVHDRIDRVVKILETMSGDLREFLMLLQTCQPIHRPLATNIFVEGQMFGRHVEKERIINFLLHNGAGKLGVLPIVGDMGVGKTTLAQHVCDDERVRSHFPIIMYSRFSCTLVMARGETTFVLESKHALGDVKQFIESVHGLKENYLTKRFLIVFEDVDMPKKQMLEELLPILRQHGKHGSKVIIITSNRDVASNMGTVQLINLKVMPHPEYWFFFKLHAFAGRDVEEDPRMVAAGKAIARKLNGSFFGAKIVGAVLKARPDPRFWCKVLRSNIGGMSLLGDGMGYISDLAENLLPSHAGMCELTISKNPFTSQTELASFDDLCQVSPSASAARPDDGLAGDIQFAKVLVCRTVLPFQSLYYTAHCAVHGADDSSKFVRIGGSGRFAHVPLSRKGFSILGS
ncbi:disease resistance protein RGA2-like [Lolium rigidum]|uniref:disease resistance protein RGA2-like n=1 Tax=Lolium rigidum TaxID=89674 RepID=UPI001F5C8A17|nr:disease resistance protein RGA2-like [Lolium rigidum]